MLSQAILIAALLIFINQILFAIEGLICKLIDILFDTFQIFAGIKTVLYNGNQDYLINVFFSNDVITAVYWGMAAIGVALTFGFAVASVIRKIFDHTGEKVKATYGQILLNIFKSILLILLMTAIVSATINATGTLMQVVDDLFNNAEELAQPSSITFNDEDFATMFRIMNTIGNYSMNPACENRFNMNACFNAVRNDMQLLDGTGAFNFSYAGAEDSWQYALTLLFNSSNVYEDLPIDSYNEATINAVSYCMDQIRTNKNFKPLERYDAKYSKANLGAMLGRTIMLTASFNAAKNSVYNESASVTDSLRLPYYAGAKDIYDWGTVDDDFNITLFDWNHLIVLVISYFVVKEMAIIIINCVARIFNIILLYLTAPGFIAAMPLDDGGKFKQWTTAFIIQSLSIFGSIFAVRLLMIFIPIVMAPQLVIFSNSFANAVAKLALLVGICVTSERASGMISGILADNAGYQSIMAGDAGSGLVSSGMAIAGRLGSAAARTGFKIGTGAISALGTASGLGTVADKASQGLKNIGASMRQGGGIVGAAKRGFQTNEQLDAKKKEQQQEADKRDTQDYRNNVTDSLSKLLDGQNSSSGGSGKAQDPPPSFDNHSSGSGGGNVSFENHADNGGGDGGDAPQSE